MKTRIIATLLILPLIACLASCKKKGPAEKAGEELDDTIENVKDAIEPSGPVENAGEKIDEALGQ